jgi:uncharacterized membrane protein (UPF0127 family)
VARSVPGSRRLIGALLPLAALTALAGPWPPPPAVGARAVLPSGEIIKLEVADEPDELSRGLKGRAELADDRGMLFILTYEGTHGFYMKDCLIPLDILWLDRHGRVLHLERELPPCHDEDEACPRWTPEVNARFVLELRGGGAAARGLETGSLILLDLAVR